MNDNRSEGFGVSVLDSVFVQIPVWIAKNTFERLLLVQSVLVRGVLLLIPLCGLGFVFVLLTYCGGYAGGGEYACWGIGRR